MTNEQERLYQQAANDLVEIGRLKAELARVREEHEASIQRCATAERRVWELEHQASPSAPSGWQQRIAAMEPWKLIGSGRLACVFCGREQSFLPGLKHRPNCLWWEAKQAGQNAKDALPPAPEGSPAKPCGMCGGTGVAKPRILPWSAICEHCGKLMFVSLPGEEPDASPAKETPASLDDLSTEQRRELERRTQDLHKRLKPFRDAIRESERITSADLDIVVTSADASPAKDAIAAAVDAQLDPLKDELIAMGRTLAKDGDA